MLVFNFLDPLICLGYVDIILLFVSKAILGVKILSRRVNNCLELWPILQVNSATSTLSNVSAYLNELNWSALSGSNYWLLWSWIGALNIATAYSLEECLSAILPGFPSL